MSELLTRYFSAVILRMMLAAALIGASMVCLAAVIPLIGFGFINLGFWAIGGFVVTAVAFCILIARDPAAT